MDRDELAFAGVARQAELIRSGDVSSRELAILSLERIERFDPQLNAFRKVMSERALVDAQQADGRRGAGDERPLLGVPIAVKDVEDVTGEVTTWGTAANFTPASQDSEFIRRLRAGGAVILGKTNLPEGAIMGETEGPAFGITRNPWNTDRSPGGSSGGSAAAVAAGLCAAATASDGAGSIRIPASHCGVVGLKPTRDRIPLAPLNDHWYGLSVAGFEARSVEDVALLMSVGAADEKLRDSLSLSPGRLRVAASTRPAVPLPVHGDVKRVVDETAGRLRSLGHEVEPSDPPYPPVSAVPPVRAGQWEGLGAVPTFLGMVRAYPFALEWNLTGHPSISVPAGRSDDGLPIGMQLVGRHGEEATLLALAAQLEGELRWTEHRPPLA